MSETYEEFLKKGYMAFLEVDRAVSPRWPVVKSVGLPVDSVIGLERLADSQGNRAPAAALRASLPRLTAEDVAACHAYLVDHPGGGWPDEGAGDGTAEEDRSHQDSPVQAPWISTPAPRPKASPLGVGFLHFCAAMDLSYLEGSVIEAVVAAKSSGEPVKDLEWAASCLAQLIVRHKGG